MKHLRERVKVLRGQADDANGVSQASVLLGTGITMTEGIVRGRDVYRPMTTKGTKRAVFERYV